MDKLLARMWSVAAGTGMPYRLMTQRRCAVGLVARLASAALFVGVSASAGANPIFVDDGAPADGDGTSWATAFTYLQDALAVASPGDEIRVADGTYTPDRDEAGIMTPGDGAATVQLKNGVTLYGGYAGLGAPDPDPREIEKPPYGGREESAK